MFDLFCPHKLNADSVQGGFFYSAELDCNYCLADPIARSLQAPEHIERMLLDLKNIRTHLEELRGNPRQKLPVHRYELRTLADLRLTIMAANGDTWAQTMLGDLLVMNGGHHRFKDPDGFGGHAAGLTYLASSRRAARR